MQTGRLIGDVAKNFGLKRRELVQQLIELGALDGNEIPRHGYEQYFKRRGGTHIVPGHDFYAVHHTTVVTPAGFAFIKQHIAGGTKNDRTTH